MSLCFVVFRCVVLCCVVLCCVVLRCVVLCCVVLCCVVLCCVVLCCVVLCCVVLCCVVLCCVVLCYVVLMQPPDPIPMAVQVLHRSTAALPCTHPTVHRHPFAPAGTALPECSSPLGIAGELVCLACTRRESIALARTRTDTRTPRVHVVVVRCVVLQPLPPSTLQGLPVREPLGSPRGLRPHDPASAAKPSEGRGKVPGLASEIRLLEDAHLARLSSVRSERALDSARSLRLSEGLRALESAGSVRLSEELRPPEGAGPGDVRGRAPESARSFRAVDSAPAARALDSVRSAIQPPLWDRCAPARPRAPSQSRSLCVKAMEHFRDSVRTDIRDEGGGGGCW